MAPPLKLEPDLEIEVRGGAEAIDPGLAARIDEIWDRECTLAPGLFDGPVLFMESFSLGRIGARRFGYRHLVARRRDPAIATAIGLKPLGVTGLLTCPEGLVFGRRAGEVSFGAGRWEPAPAGVLDRPDCRTVVLGELSEELGLEPSAIVSMEPVALVEDPGNGVCDILVRMTTAAPAAEIERVLRASGSGEYSRIAVVGQQDLPRFLAANESELLPNLRSMLHAGGLLAQG